MSQNLQKMIDGLPPVDPRPSFVETILMPALTPALII